jgi:hypothetical protein
VRRLTILLAAIGALLLLPAAQAFAEGTATVVLAGEGSGEVSSVGGYAGGGEYEGFPPIECSNIESEEKSECGPSEMEFGFLGGSYEGIYLDSTPGPGSELAGWKIEGSPFGGFHCKEPPDSGFSWCQALQTNLGENITVTARFEVPTPFTAETTGSGEGTVECSTDEGNSFHACEAEYLSNTELILKAEANAGSEFTGWTGCDSEPEVGEETRCEVLIDEEHTVSANFDEIPQQPLTLNINSGEGTVVSDPAGLECTGSTGESCEAEFEEGAEVTLTASAAEGFRFQKWEGCPSADGHHCTVTMNEAQEVGVRFRADYALTITRAAGSEPGLVLKYPGFNGIACEYVCSEATYRSPAGTLITLDTYEYPGNHLHFQEFTGGTGDAAVCDGETKCKYTVTETDSSIEALFVKDAKVALSMEKAGGGDAFIKSKSGIYCSGNCSGSSAEYYEGQEVEVTWDLNPGTHSIEFSGEAGTCPASSEEDTGSCEIEMDEAHSFVATLE